MTLSRSIDSFSRRQTRTAVAKRNRQVIAQTRTLRILCVDDEVHVLSLMNETLTAEGYEVQTALDGVHALQKIATAERPYDLLIVDGRMPNIDGWSLILQARNGGYKGKVIVFSAWLDADEHRRYQKLNIDRVIEKPPRSGELIGAVKEIAAGAL